MQQTEPPIATNQRYSLIDLTQHYWNFYRRTLNRMEWPDKLGVTFNSRLKRILGRAYAYRRKSIGLAYVEYATWTVQRAELHAELAAHEVAHIVADNYYQDDCGHDHRWKQIFAMSGFNPRRIMPVVGPNSITAKCPACHLEGSLTKKMLLKSQQDGVILRCRKCKTPCDFEKMCV
jgi:predicted SprT family Zn-dependent metalloprotease